MAKLDKENRDIVLNTILPSKISDDSINVIRKVKRRKKIK